MRNGCFACLLLALAPACFHPNYDRPTCGQNSECPDGLSCSEAQVCEPSGGGDAGLPTDAEPPDAPPDAQQCFGSFVKVCPSALPTTPIVVVAVGPDLDINTDAGASASPLCDPGIASYCVVAATAITIATTKKIRGHGARPLVLVALGSFELFGDIDVSSSTDGAFRGAGASMTVCSTPAAPTPATVNSGGFGGSFGGRGGDGEIVDGDRGVGSAAIGFPAELRGGCPGGAGGGGGAGGLGGGAVSIFGATVHVDGKINASGAGGRGGPELKSGGGGGGSGGMIVLDVPQTAITLGLGGRLFANGGGGGEGGAGSGSGSGQGADGNASSAPNVSGTGGNSGNAGGNGGPGSGGTALAGGASSGQSQNDGGGGAGGGGAGFIHAPGISGANVIAPPSLDPPSQ
jgi:hypothetical protein